MYSHQLKSGSTKGRAGAAAVRLTAAWTSQAFEAAAIDAFPCDFVDPEQVVPTLPTPRRNSDQSYCDFWHLSGHRLTCGDARELRATRALMNQKGNMHVQATLTSPQ